MTEIAQEKPTSLLLELADHTVRQLPGGREIQRGSDEEKRLAEEVEKAFQNRERARQVLEALFPEGIPIGPLFFDRLNDLHMRLGWGEFSHRATGLLLSLAVGRLPADSGEALLNELPAIQGHRFFQALETLTVLFHEIELRPEFASEWFPAIVRRIGNDLASGGFWKPLGAYCEKRPDSSLEIVRRLLASRDEPETAVGAYILGVLRAMEMDEPMSTAFKKLESEFVGAQTANIRFVYHRSWIQTAHRGKMSRRDLESLTERMSLETRDDQQQAFWIVCRIMSSPVLQEDCFSFGLDWLRANVSPTIGPAAKFSVVDFAAEFAEKDDTGRWEGAELILALQPIPLEDKGTWQRLERFLVRRLETDTEAFIQFALELAQRDASGWLKVMQEPRGLEWLISEMQKRDLGALVGQLLLSRDAGCRRLGLFFFHKLGLSLLPLSLFEEIGEQALRLIFYELQRSMAFGESTARLLVLLIPHVERQSAAFQEEFYAEVVFQAKNYAGVCREEFERKADRFPLLKRALADAARYFEDLSKVRDSAISAMEVPGYNHARRVYARRFAEEVSKGTEEASILARFARKVRLLYGRAWSSFREGKLSQPSQLQSFLSSVEVPRLEEIDPEGMALRRLHVSMQISRLTKELDTKAAGE